ncbi:hypothetical protein [Angustibacter aerolatus]
MTTTDEVRGWLTGRLPQEWTQTAPEVTVDKDEITVVVHVDAPQLPEAAGEPEQAAAAAGRATSWRESTRRQRMAIADETEHRYGRKVAWGVVVGEHRELFTHLAVPVMTRLRQPERQVLDTLVASGVARSRAEALVWCVRLTGRHAEAWLGELREAMTAVDAVRAKGPGL